MEEKQTAFGKFDLGLLYEHNLKIFGDIFESLVGAVYLDSQSLDQTQLVVNRLVDPYVYIYANAHSLQKDSKSLFYIKWSQTSYTRDLSFSLKKEWLDCGVKYRLSAAVSAPCDKQEVLVFQMTFQGSAKSKSRTFFKRLYWLFSGFAEEIDKAEVTVYEQDPKKTIEALKNFCDAQSESFDGRNRDFN